MARHSLDLLVESSADPAAASLVLDRLGTRVGVLLDDEFLAETVVSVAAASTGLGHLLVDDPDAIDALADLGAHASVTGDTPAELARSYRLAFLRVVAADLVGTLHLDATMSTLSRLASEVFERAMSIEDVDDLAVIGMGKYGADELNYLSDVDVMLVGSGDTGVMERNARRVVQTAGTCFLVDLDLRPEGRDGALVRSLDSYEAYWKRWARPWEFQALLKARPTVGPDSLVAATAASIDRFLWNRPFARDDLSELRRLKRRAEEDIGRRGLIDREVKRGRGGIRDIEFSVQLLQLVHGGADPELRVRSTRGALAELVRGSYVDEREAAELDRAYVFLRRVEHALQLADLRRTHVVPAERADRRRLARAIGYVGADTGGPTERFDHDLAMHRLAVRRVHDGWYFRPLLDAFAGAGTIARDVSDARLAAFGFAEADRTREAVAELTRGLTRSSRMMRQLLPLLLDWLSGAPDPDLGLLALRRLAAGQRSESLVTAFRDSAEVARGLCTLVGTSPLAADLLEANPDLVHRIDDMDRLRTDDPGVLVERATAAVAWRPVDDRPAALRRWFRRNLFGVVARELLGGADTVEVGSDLADLAEAVLQVALADTDPQVPVSIIGLGRLGAAELSYGSDVDLVVVYEGAGELDRKEAERVASRVFRTVGGSTPATRIFAVDPDLRPEGRSGPLVRSLDSYTVYLERWAETWERQVLLRARPVAGDRAVGRRFGSLVQQYVWAKPPLDVEVRDIRRMKARMETERAGVDARNNLKLGPGGLSDVEFTAQLLQWRHDVRPAAPPVALRKLAQLGVIDMADAGVLIDAYEFGNRLRARIHLVTGGHDLMPVRPEHRSSIARSLDLSTLELDDTHRRVMRRCRAVVERLFYRDMPTR